MLISAQAFCRDVFLLSYCTHVLSVILWVFWCGHIVNMFSSVNRNNPTSLDEYFSATVSNCWVLCGGSLHSALGHCVFSTITSQGSVATRGYLSTALSEMYWWILKIGQHVAKLETKVEWYFFSRHGLVLSELECGPMPNVMVALPNIGGALCSTPQVGWLGFNGTFNTE